jgi:Putative beta-lactamase-inhibitor-like, PepSY-like
MKTLITSAIALCIGFNASAQKVQEKAVPEAVVKTFKAKYPSAKEVKWEKEKGNYEAEFEIKETSMSAIFNPAGNLMESETRISRSMLPKAISEALAKDYPGYKIEEMAKIESEGKVTYEAEVEKGEKSMDLIFDENGKLLKTISKEEKKKD